MVKRQYWDLRLERSNITPEFNMLVEPSQCSFLPWKRLQDNLMIFLLSKYLQDAFDNGAQFWRFELQDDLWSGSTPFGGWPCNETGLLQHLSLSISNSSMSKATMIPFEFTSFSSGLYISKGSMLFCYLLVEIKLKLYIWLRMALQDVWAHGFFPMKLNVDSIMSVNNCN